MKEILLVLMGTLELAPKKDLLLILIKQKQSIVWVCIKLVIVVICLWIEKKSKSLKPVMKMRSFQPGFA